MKSRKKRGFIFKILAALSIGVSLFGGINILSLSFNVPTWMWGILAIGFILVIIDLIDGGLND